jgi:hypothetical protein
MQQVKKLMNESLLCNRKRLQDKTINLYKKKKKKGLAKTFYSMI